MDADLFTQIKNEIKTRDTWEEKQGLWYRMRYEGIKRATKPYPNAPDMHYPLVDSMIEKIKPFYISQLYANERLAAFASGKPQSENLTSLAEKLFDYTLKQRSNFERAIFTGIDHMLMYGRGPVKIYWDTTKNKLAFSSVRPIYIIVPHWTEELNDADWLVHVMHMSEAAYRRNEKFKQDDTLIESIKGKGNDSGAQTSQAQTIARREGITVGQNEEQIVLWEVYSRNEAGDIVVDTVSPMNETAEIRAQFGIPYDHKQFPFVDLRYEIADPDYYSPRGLTEILNQFELDLCKLWNHKLQFLDFVGNPTYKNVGGNAANPTNWQNKPGGILPQGIDVIEATGAPLDFKEEMQMQRALAEDRVAVPDLSAGEHLSGKRGAKGEVTATQINALMTQSGGGNDMRSRIFRLQLALLYGQAWSLTTQYLPDVQKMLEDFTKVPKEAMHDDYRLAPSGSADSGSKEQRVAKAVAYYQTFNNSPYVKQDELTKWTFEQDDPSLSARLFQEPADAHATQAEQQAQEIVLMLNGFPAPVQKADDDATHLTTVDQWVEYQGKIGKPIDPEMAGHLLQHGAAHAQQIQEKQDKEGKALLQQLQPLQQYLQAIVQQAQAMPPQGAPGDASQQPAAPGPAQGAPADDAKRPSMSINYKDAPDSIKRQMEEMEGFRPAVEAPMVDMLKNSGGGAGRPGGKPAGPAPLKSPAAKAVAKEAAAKPAPAPVVVPAPVVHVAPPVVHVHHKSIKGINARRGKDGKVEGYDIIHGE